METVKPIKSTHVTLKVNSDAEIRILRALIENYPIANGINTLGNNSAHPDLIIINVPEYHVTYQHLSSITKIIVDIPLIPTLDLASHLDVLTVIKIADIIGISQEKMYNGAFHHWRDHRKWIDLRLPEYMYLVANTFEELVDFRKYFRLAKDPFDMAARAVTLKEIKSNSGLFIEMLKFFSDFKFEICFDMNNDKVQAKIDQLKKERERCGHLFLLNPHDHVEFFNHCTHNQNVWSAKDITVVKRPAAGVSNIVDIGTAMSRFNEFTCGAFDRPLNPTLPADTKFPYANVVFAGGGAAKILSADYNSKNARQSDVDIFTIGETFEDRNRVFQQLIQWFDTSKLDVARTYYAIRGSVLTIYIKDVQRKFQIVSSNAKNIYDVIGRFDLTHIQWALHQGRFYGTPQAAYAMREKITRFGNLRQIKAYRMIKAMYCGYDVEKSPEIMEKIIDLTSLVDDPTNLQLQTIIREFHSYYYPATMQSYEPAEETQHILAMIGKDSNATLVTDDPKFAVNNVTVSGDFNDNYESISFTTFNAGAIMNKAQGRRVTRLLLRSKHGVMRLTSDFLTVTRTASDDEGITIVTKSETEPFIEFTKQLEGVVYRMFRPGGVTNKLFNDVRETTFKIPRYVLDAQITRGYSCIRNQRGAALNIEEDVKPGDRIQIMFIIEIVMEEATRCVNLKPIKFIKFVQRDDLLVASEDTDDIDAEIVASEQPTEIKYEDVY